MQKRKIAVRGFNLFEVTIIIVISCIVTALVVGTVISNNYRTSFGITYRDLLNDDNIKDFLNVYSEVTNDYYENVDKSKVIDSAIKGIMGYLGDKYSSYLDSYDTKELTDKLSGEYKGIGISINEYGKIMKVTENTPASKAGLLKGDIITSVNGNSINSNNAFLISKYIKDTDEYVLLEISRNNEILSFNIELSNIPSTSISSRIIDSNDKKIGYIYIDSFSTTLASQISNEIGKMNDMNGLIIDIRNNGGGYLKAAQETASLFLEKNKVIYSLEGKNETTVYKDETDEKTTYPIVILMNSGSASASEILAAALKESYGAILVGEVSYGKGLVQVTYKMDDGSMVKYSSAKWLTPNGNYIEGIGLTPDYELKNTKYNDEQLEKAIELLS